MIIITLDCIFSLFLHLSMETMALALLLPSTDSWLPPRQTVERSHLVAGQSLQAVPRRTNLHTNLLTKRARVVKTLKNR